MKHMHLREFLGGGWDRARELSELMNQIFNMEFWPTEVDMELTHRGANIQWREIGLQSNYSNREQLEIIIDFNRF